MNTLRELANDELLAMNTANNIHAPLNHCRGHHGHEGGMNGRAARPERR